MSRVFLDASVPIYTVGREHPLKEPCGETLAFVASHPHGFFTNAEVLQEMLHRYLGLKRWSEGKATVQDFAVLLRGNVEPVRTEGVLLACQLADRPVAGDGRTLRERCRARDLLHSATMLRVGSTRIVTADKVFDDLRAEGIERLDPSRVHVWRNEV